MPVVVSPLIKKDFSMIQLPIDRVLAQPPALPRAKDPVYIWRDSLFQPIWMGGAMIYSSDEAACDALFSFTFQKMGAVYCERVIGWRSREGGGGWVPVSKLLARATSEGWVSM